MRLFASISGLEEENKLIRQRRFGVIIVRSGCLDRIRFRPLPKVVSIPELGFLGSWYHRYTRRDECRLFYNQPWGHSSFLALRYVESGVGTSLATVNVALTALDEIARIKKADALLCDAANLRLSDRVMKRYGWEAHKPQRWHRNFIKRFYGSYPELPEKMRYALYGKSWEHRQFNDVSPVSPAIQTDEAASQDELQFDHHVLSPPLRRHMAASAQLKVSC
ncbi:MAG: hypothetical protein MPJ50_10950 [Pirellulales bacterium]|nr:hypothetical protein [Pirellulales bacterium]